MSGKNPQSVNIFKLLPLLTVIVFSGNSRALAQTLTLKPDLIKVNSTNLLNVNLTPITTVIDPNATQSGTGTTSTTGTQTTSTTPTYTTVTDPNATPTTNTTPTYTTVTNPNATPTTNTTPTRDTTTTTTPTNQQTPTYTPPITTQPAPQETSQPTTPAVTSNTNQNTPPPAIIKSPSRNLPNPVLTPSTETPQTENPIAATCPTPGNNTTPDLSLCPKTEPVKAKTVIPQFPLVLMITPLAAVGLFWLILSYLNYSQARTSNLIEQKRTTSQNKLNRSTSQQKAYQKTLDFISQELASSQPLNYQNFLKTQAQIEILGSAEMRKICQNIAGDFQNNNRQNLKTNLSLLVTQIKKEV